jgi:hypothetical protein
MVSGLPPVGITQNERFFSCDTVLLGVRYRTFQFYLFFPRAPSFIGGHQKSSLSENGGDGNRRGCFLLE